MTYEFITSRKGQINQINLSRYDITERYQKDHQGRLKFLTWLDKKSGVNLYSIDDKCFLTFDTMPNISGPQYRHKSSVTMVAPFSNTEKISNYLGKLVRKKFEENYERFLNTNIFKVSELILSPFKLKKCFSFDLEVFNDGCFFINLLPTTKIVSEDKVSIDFVRRLIREYPFKTNQEDPKITLINTDEFYRKKIELNSRNVVKISEIIEGKNFIATFDYEFLAQFSPQIFREITKQTIKKVNQSIEFLVPISNDIKLPDFVEIETKPFYKVKYTKISAQNNLEVGQKFITGKQSAAHFKGMYKPVYSKIILPICYEQDYLEDFSNKVNELNRGGQIEILSKIDLGKNDPLPMEKIREITKGKGKDLLIILFTPHQLSGEILAPLKKLKVHYQLFYGELGSSYDANARLSNFTVKCLEKLGGVLCVIHNTYEPETTYFIGIDLGHTTIGEEKFSNLGMVLFDHRGIIIKSYVEKKIPRNEALTEKTVSKCFDKLLTHLKRVGRPHPQKIIIHRDGKLHKSDIEIIVKQLSELFDIWDVDVVEIIKSGYPVMGLLEINVENREKKYGNPESGDCWILTDKKYAILATNTQSTDNESILNPLIIKHRLGKTDFEIILNHIYWFTKVYTNNLYTSSRLPATTLKANNIVSTSIKEHKASYLG